MLWAVKTSGSSCFHFSGSKATRSNELNLEDTEEAKALQSQRVPQGVRLVQRSSLVTGRQFVEAIDERVRTEAHSSGAATRSLATMSQVKNEGSGFR